MVSLQLLKTIVPRTVRESLREVRTQMSVRHVSGVKAIPLQSNEAVVTCVVKNGEFFIEQFIDHYLDIGFRHIYFLDNGSDDRTIEIASRQKNVTIYSSILPIGGLQGLLKKHLAERVVVGGWCLDVDVDEFFDYPFSNRISLTRFLEYLNEKRYTAVVTQMLDMFSEKTLSWLAKRQDEHLKKVHRYYDISQIRKVDYCKEPLTVAHGYRNQIANSGTEIKWGGIRKTVFGVECLLTKHSLFRTGAGLHLFPHVHYVNGARLADVSGTLLHYKFASNAQSEAAQNKQGFRALSQGYDRVMELIIQRPNMEIKGAKAREFGEASDLLESQFLYASDDYKSYAALK